MRLFTVLAAGCLFITACNNRKKADLLVLNARIYTVDSSFSTAEAMAVKDGKILATGSGTSIEEQYDAPEKLDAGGKAIFPGFIDAHAHFCQYGLSLQTADLTGTESWQAILDTLAAFAKTHPDGWLIGHGWDQNDWAEKAFPDNTELSRLFPDRPVLLSRVDGHASMANEKALSLAGLKPGVTLTGGEVVVKNGKLTGLLVDNAVDLVAGHIPDPGADLVSASLQQAQQNCFAVGLTTVDDCGLMPPAMKPSTRFKSRLLKMRVYER
ncbi:MAG: amidohydrolase family protein [Flavihumibacter sp.]